jgi:hypothetical protein
MTEFFDALVPAAGELPPGRMAARFVQAACLGVAVAVVYYLTQRKSRTEAAPMASTLVLLCVLIAMVTQVIGDNVARAFSLAGALSIIRFRTVVDDTRDTAFVIAAVVAGMAVGANQIGVAIAGLPVVAAAAWALSAWGAPTAVSVKKETKRASGSMVVRIGIGVAPEKAFAELFAKCLDAHDLLTVATARQGAALDLTYNAVLKPGSSPVPLVAEMNRIEGVQGVEWKANS